MIFSWRTSTGLPPVKLSGYTELDPETLLLLRGPDAVILRLRLRLGFWRGSWFLDQRLGIPYAQQIFRKNPSRNLLIQIFGDTIRATPGVASLVSLTLSRDKVRRTARVSFDALLDDGDTTIKAQDAPLLLRRF